MKIKYYALKNDGTPLGEIGRMEVVEIQETDQKNEVPTISLTDGFSGEFTIDLKRKDKKIFCSMFGMPKYKVTEWMFPKKKKRGTIKRKRRQSKQTAAATIRALRRAMMRFGVTAEQASEEIKKLFQRIQQQRQLAEMMHRADVPVDAPNFSK